MQPLSLLDALAVLLLAAAAASRARTSGAHFTGAAVLAVASALSAPLARDALLGLAPGTLDQPFYVTAALAGAIAGGLAAQWRHAWRAFFWLDAAGLALCAGVAAARGAVMGLGAAGCLVLGVLAGVAGGFVRDIALGDIARFVEEDMYATAAALGAMATVAVFWYGGLPAWQSALAGAVVALLLRGRRGGARG